MSQAVRRPSDVWCPRCLVYHRPTRVVLGMDVVECPKLEPGELELVPRGEAHSREDVEATR